MGDSYTDALNNKHEKIINDLQELQAVETYLFTKIQESSGSNENDETQKISSHIENLSETRTNLLKSLQNLYSGASSEADFNSNLLGNQTVMGQQLASEITRAKQEKKRLIAEKNNKQRLAQIGEYEYAKNNSHKSILKIIVYGSFFVLIMIFLNSNDLFPTFLTKIIIVIICFIVFLIIIKRLYWNFKRNNIDYSKFTFPKNIGTFDKQTENTFSISDLMGMKCEDTSGAKSEGFALLNKNGCKSCKNIHPSNNLNNNTFKNTSLTFSTVN